LRTLSKLGAALLLPQERRLRDRPLTRKKKMMNERQDKEMVSTKEIEEDLGSVWVACPDHQEEQVSYVETALVEAEARVYRGKEPPRGVALNSIVLCSSEVEGLASRLKRVRAVAPDTKVLILSSRPDSRLADEAMREGASGFIYPGMPPELIVRAFRVASKGAILVPRELLEECLGEKASREDLVVVDPQQIEFLERVLTYAIVGEATVVPRELLEAFLVEEGSSGRKAIASFE
jgi:DNA-binding NarL/FixJ family response regulator